ncbi:MAG: DNA repair protein RecO [Leptolyngbyaceae cyanobacterium]
MSRTYKATGINLKAIPMGEADRLMTILTREHGLVRVMAVGARKQNAKLGGRSDLFVVNDLLIAKGRSLDKVIQAETLASYPGLGQDLKKLTASQYLAELSLCQAMSDQPQEDLFILLNEHLKRLERSPDTLVMAHLTHAVFQLLALGGVAPQVQQCCVTRRPVTPNFADAHWRIVFSIPSGGVVFTAKVDRPTLDLPITAAQLALLQHLAQATLPDPNSFIPHLPLDSSKVEGLWRGTERILRLYAQYHFDRIIRSATLIDACFASPNEAPALPAND